MKIYKAELYNCVFLDELCFETIGGDRKFIEHILVQKRYGKLYELCTGIYIKKMALNKKYIEENKRYIEYVVIDKLRPVEDDEIKMYVSTFDQQQFEEMMLEYNPIYRKQIEKEEKPKRLIKNK